MVTKSYNNTIVTKNYIFKIGEFYDKLNIPP